MPWQSVSDVRRKYAPRADPKRARADRREADRIARQVEVERAKARRGRGLKADTGDVTRNTKRPTLKETTRASLAGSSQPRLLTPPPKNESFRQRVDRELSGRGALADALGDVANFIVEHAVGTGTGGGPTAALGVSRKVTGSRGGRGVGIAAATSPSAYRLKDVPELENALKDVINFPATALPSLYVPAASLVEAARGDTRRGRQLIQDVKETDPIVNLLSGRPGKALELAREHPGLTALEVAGAKGAAGRGAGRAVRGTGATMKAAGRASGSKALVSRGERVRRVAAVETRADARALGTGLVVRREYSRDLSRKAGQVRRDKSRAAAAQKKRVEAGRVEGTDPDLAIRLRKQANQLDPTVVSDRDVRARVNLLESRGENLRRVAVGDVDKRASAIIKESGDRGAAPVLVASGITKGKRADLVAYRDELAVAHEGLKDAGKRAANVRLRRAIDESVKSAKGPDLPKVVEAAKRYSREIDKPLDSVLSEMGLLARERGERAKLIPYAAREMSAHKDPESDVIVGADGAPLSTDTIRASARATREVEPSYVSQAPNARGAGAYYRASAAEPTVGVKARTEKPTIEGTFDADPEMLRAGAMKRQGLVSASRNFRSLIGETGLRARDGAVLTNLTRARGEALKTALEAKHGVEFDLVSVRPWAASREQVRAMEEAINAGGDFDARAVKTFREGLEGALDGKGDGPFALVPSAAAKQARQHLRVLDPSDFGKFARGVRSAFTRTVLTTSPGPTVGNLVEPAVRSAVMRAGPVSAVRGIRTARALRKMDPEAYDRLVATIGRGKVALASRQRYVDPKQFDEGFKRQVTAGYQAFKRARGVNRIVAAWGMWTHFVFEQLNGRAEAFYRQGPMLGKVLRDSGLMDHSLLAVSKQSMREAAAGLRDTPTQALLARKLDDSYGRYQGFSPGGRKLIAEYTPFAAWWLSSANFMFRVLPRDHPALLGLTASLEQATEEWRASEGLDLFLGKGTLDGWLQGTVPAGKLGRLKLAHNTPAGAFTDPGGSVASLVLPQGENLLNAFQGLDWKNKPLRNEDGSKYDPLQQALYAVGEMAKSTMPAIAVPLRAEKYGTNPRSLLSPVLIPPSQKAPDAAEPLSEADRGEADRLTAEADREAELLRREADRLSP